MIFRKGDPVWACRSVRSKTIWWPAVIVDDDSPESPNQYRWICFMNNFKKSRKPVLELIPLELPQPGLDFNSKALSLAWKAMKEILTNNTSRWVVKLDDWEEYCAQNGYQTIAEPDPDMDLEDWLLIRRHFLDQLDDSRLDLSNLSESHWGITTTYRNRRRPCLSALLKPLDRDSGSETQNDEDSEDECLMMMLKKRVTFQDEPDENSNFPPCLLSKAGHKNDEGPEALPVLGDLDASPIHGEPFEDSFKIHFEANP